MIIKEAYGNDTTVETLQALADRADCTPDTRARIEREIRNVRAGMRGERDAAYEMKMRWGDSKRWMVIHDLRLEIDGLVAQIDHLVINRLLEIYVCESKHFSEGVSINEHGEFVGFFNSKPYGVPSPIAQNERHILVLQKFFEAEGVGLPKRFGFSLTPSLKSVVLVSKNARISRPRTKIDGLEAIIKLDQLSTFIEKTMDESVTLFAVATKLVGEADLESFARRLASKHAPLDMNWAAKFGMSKEVIASPVTAKLDPQAEPVVTVVEPVKEAAVEPVEKAQKLICHGCDSVVPLNVARFCWFNKPKFGGQVFCRDCQPKHGTA